MKLSYLTMKYTSQPKKVPTISVGDNKPKSRLSAWFYKLKDKLAFNITWRF